MAEARVVRPDRRQLRWDMIDLEGLLPKIRASASKKSFKTGEKLIKIEGAVGLSVWLRSSRS
jgi:hypothetical protein